MSSSEEKNKMTYRYLGKTGLKVSTFSLGSWLTYGTDTAQEQTTALVDQAYKAGINFFDTAEVYASGDAEKLLGQAFQDLEWASDRSNYVVSTKIYWGGDGVNQRGLSRKHIIEGTKKSLKRLQLEYVDLIFAHRPDEETPMEEIVRAFNWVIEAGMAFYWGTSEWSAQQIQEACTVAKDLGLMAPKFEQPEYNMFHREKLEKEFLTLFEGSNGLGTTIWSPLASGVLTGKYNDGIPEGSRLAMDSWVPKLLRERLETEEGKAKLQKVRDLTEIAESLSISMAQLALAWCARNENVSTVILGAKTPEQLEENINAIGAVEQLTDEIMEKIDGILQTKPTQNRKTFR